MSYEEFKHNKELTEEQFKMFEVKDELRPRNPWFSMRLEKGNNLFLLIPDKRGSAAAGGWVHKVEGVKFSINCYRNISEACYFCKLYDYYSEGGENDVAKNFKPITKFAFMGLDWKIFSEEPPSCLGNLEDKGKFDKNSKKCAYCAHSVVCQNRKYAISALTNAGPEIYGSLRAFLSDPDSDPTDFNNARLINIVKNAEGMKRPEGVAKYYDPKKVSDAEGGRINLFSDKYKWIFDVISATAPEDLRIVFKPNVSKRFILSQLSESERRVVGILESEEEPQNLETPNNSEGLNEGTKSGLDSPPCFGNAELFSEIDMDCVGGKDKEQCWHFEECRDTVKVQQRSSRIPSYGKGSMFS